MFAILVKLLLVARSRLKSRARLEAENIVLRQRVIILSRQSPSRVRPQNIDRLIFVWLYRCFPAILSAINLVKPETVIGWHRRGFLSLRSRYLADDDGEDDERERFPGFSAVSEACHNGDPRILQQLGPDPARDDFDELNGTGGSGAVVELLARLALPQDVGSVIRRQVACLAWSLVRPPSLDTLRRLFRAGFRWETSKAHQIADVRRSLLHTADHTFVEVIKLLATNGNCSQEVLHELGRTRCVLE
jgi:hypothetical protein